ncbi:MAG: 6-bladed beta-propeller [Phycisphaerae bacterium]|nr:6-bladed beta-propeller [Phycisphaerae bacterium]
MQTTVQRLKQKFPPTAAWFAAVLLTIAWGGCGSVQQPLFTDTHGAIVWPEPPEPARIKYLGQLSGEGDLGRRVSGAEAFGRLIFGRKDVGVFKNPRSVAVDGDRLFVAAGGAAVIHIMDLKTRKYVQFSKLDGDSTLRSPVGIAIVEDNVYVSDSVLGRVCVFDTAGNYRFAFGHGILQRPSGIAYGRSQQRLYVVDTKRHVVDMFDLRGKHLGSLGDQGPKGLRFPTFVSVDRQGRIYVSDTLNYCIQVFEPDGRFVRSIGEHGNRPGYFAHPSGIATDRSGNIYVTDKHFENVQIFNADGQILMALGHEGRGPGEFWLPMGLFIDDRDRIFVADSFNKRIQIFQLLEAQAR